MAKIGRGGRGKGPLEERTRGGKKPMLRFREGTGRGHGLKKGAEKPTEGREDAGQWGGPPKPKASETERKNPSFKGGNGRVRQRNPNGREKRWKKKGQITGGTFGDREGC